jgi:tetratricopeptide (TPR) repeat protein
MVLGAGFGPPGAVARADSPGEAELLSQALDEDSLAAALLPPPRESGSAIERAWLAPASTLEERVWRTRRTALERGVWNLDAAARALFASGGAPLDRAEAAVRLAPDLPAGHMELARALWLHGDSPLGAIRTAASALGAFPRHPEGALWLAGSLLMVLAAGLVAGGMLCIAVLSLMAAPHAAHDLGDLFSRSMPAFARTALLAGALLLAAIQGEGVLGLVLALLVVGAVYGSSAQRAVLGLAAVALLLGAFPVARLAGATLEALPADPVAQAVLSTSRGLPLRADVARLEAADGSDLMAKEALARLARRSGNLGRADALYQELLAFRAEDLVILNNAANVRLQLGHMEAALQLYRRALGVAQSPIVLFNLSQAHGQAFQVDDLTRMLEMAQAADGELVADLTRLQGAQPEGFVVDLPVSNAALWRRVLDPRRGAGLAAEFRAPFAPGRLGSDPLVAGGVCLGTMLLGGMLGRRFRHSRWCTRCGCRVCTRCQPEISGGDLCGACRRLFLQPGKTDRGLRLARIETLREREALMDRLAWLASVAVPGVAGALARRPLRSLLGTVCFATAVSALVWRWGVVPDPLTAGAAGPFAFLCVAVLMGVAYAIVVGSSLSARRRL